MPTVTIESYRPGLIGETVRLHALYYAKHWGFDVRFETQVASELGAFMARADQTRDGLWWAAAGGQYGGTVAVDGSLGETDGARLRWFIVDEQFQGAGVGARLLGAALAFCRAQRFPKVHLWTFKGLDAARALYERNGFTLVEERPFTDWGAPIIEQKFEWIS